MEKNIGPVDKIIRIVVAAVLLIVGFTYQSSLGGIEWLLYIIAIILIITVILGSCLPYKLLKINTNKSSKAPEMKVKSPVKTVAKKSKKKKRR